MSEPEIALGLNRGKAKYAIVTSSPPSWHPLAKVTNQLMAEYARDWGYHFFADVSEVTQDVSDQFGNRQEVGIRGFIKFEMLWHYFKRYEAVVWIDSDALITNKAIRLESFLQQSPHDLIVGYDYNGIHTTVIIMRTTDLMRDFLFACNNAGRKYFLTHPWHEMEAMRYFLGTPPYRDAVKYLSVKQLCPILHTEYERFGLPADVASTYSWEPKDFILHLSALSLERRIQLAYHFADPAHHHLPVPEGPQLP